MLPSFKLENLGKDSG